MHFNGGVTSTADPLRVHVLIDSLNWGGAETLLADFATGAPSAGIELSVGYLQDVNDSPSAGRLRASGVEPELVGVRKLLDRKSALRVRSHLARIRPDIVHTHLGAADALGTVAARSLRLPAVSTIHLVENAGPAGSAREAARRRVMALARRRGSGRVIAVSDAARAAYVEGGWDRPERVVTVHNGIAALRPAAPRAGTRAALGLSDDVPVIAMASVLRDGKGHDTAAAALARLRRDHPDVTLLVIGEGPQRAEIEALLEPLGDSVRLLGLRDDVLDLLAAADAVLLPTRMDAFPTVLLEAAAVGVPAVATAVGGVPEIVVDGETGLLVAPPPGPEEVAAALSRLLSDADLRARMGACARRRFETRFTAAHWAARCRAVYDAVLG